MAKCVMMMIYSIQISSHTEVNEALLEKNYNTVEPQLSGLFPWSRFFHE